MLLVGVTHLCAFQGCGRFPPAMCHPSIYGCFLQPQVLYALDKKLWNKIRVFLH